MMMTSKYETALQAILRANSLAVAHKIAEEVLTIKEEESSSSSSSSRRDDDGMPSSSSSSKRKHEEAEEDVTPPQHPRMDEEDDGHDDLDVRRNQLHAFEEAGLNVEDFIFENGNDDDGDDEGLGLIDGMDNERNRWPETPPPPNSPAMSEEEEENLIMVSDDETIIISSDDDDDLL